VEDHDGVDQRRRATVGAIQFISYEQVLWGQMAAATIVAALPQLVLSLMVQKYIARGLTMGAVR
jgi:multiple sugar transport system permease protein